MTGNAFALEPTVPDRFDLVGVAETVVFACDAAGKVVAVSDSQGRYPRETDVVPVAITGLFSDGDLPTYVYTPPTRAEPGLMVGDATEHGLPPTMITDIVNDVCGDADMSTPF